jgi:Carboxypeptidase regulatory-like domain
MRSRYQIHGFSMVEAIIVSAVMLLFFGGLVTMVIYVMDLVQNARVKLSALSAATERIEFIRSLPYDSVGTVAGIPSGTIPQNRTVVLNNYTLHERVLIEFVDDDADGQGGADTNGIIADYKRVKVEYTWNITGATSSAFLVSTIVPRSIETTAGGGTIRVNVFDATTVPVTGASVRLLNTTGTTTVDITRLTDTTGTALFAGAPANANYEVFVSKAGYSSDQTHVATTSNPSPNTPPLSVLEADVSTMNFQIDRLSDLSIAVFSDINEQMLVEPFTNMSGVATSSGVATLGGELELAGNGPGIYVASGTAFLTSAAPATIERWELFDWAKSVPADTTARVRFYVGTSTTTLVSDTDLPGNSSGFTDRQVLLQTLVIGTYPELTVGIELTTTNTAVTPEIDEATLYYRESSTPRSGASYSLRGNKTIGTGVYKFTTSGLLDGAGAVDLDDIEWDAYELTFPTTVIKSACPAHPIVLEPGSTLTTEVVSGAASTDHLRVVVLDGAGLPVPGVNVDISRPGFSDTAVTNTCGNAFFSGLTAAADYVLTFDKAGYSSATINPQNVAGSSVAAITMAPL